LPFFFPTSPSYKWRFCHGFRLRKYLNDYPCDIQ
jgi:hypothetical protein